jgi:hypothetical protein
LLLKEREFWRTTKTSRGEPTFHERINFLEPPVPPHVIRDIEVREEDFKGRAKG